LGACRTGLKSGTFVVGELTISLPPLVFYLKLVAVVTVPGKQSTHRDDESWDGQPCGFVGKAYGVRLRGARHPIPPWTIPNTSGMELLVLQIVHVCANLHLFRFSPHLHCTAQQPRPIERQWKVSEPAALSSLALNLRCGLSYTCLWLNGGEMGHGASVAPTENLEDQAFTQLAQQGRVGSGLRGVVDRMALPLQMWFSLVPG
jgi:hypothetical protein